MTLQIVKAGLLGVSHHFGIQLLGFGNERDVHERTELLFNSALEHDRLVQIVIQNLGLALVVFIHCFQTAIVQQIAEHLAAAVDAPAVGGVVHRAVVGMGIITHVYGNLGIQVSADQILTDDDDGHTGGADVLLNTTIDHAIIADIAGLGQEHGGLVGNQNLTLGVGQLLEGGAVNGFVFADVNIVCVFPDGKVAAIGQVGVVAILGTGDALNITVFLGFLESLIRPCAGDDVVSHAILHQIHGDHGKLQCCATLDEQNLIVVGDVHQLAQISFSVVVNFLEDLRAVGHFHDAHTAATVVHHFITNFFENGNGHSGGAGREIIATIVHCITSNLCCI